jgi:hypothetical protein
MPYCRKCGTELDETARFCHVCGTPVAAVTPAVKQPAPERRPVHVLPVAIMITVLVSVVVIGALLVLPVSPVHFNQTNRVPDAGMDNLFLDFHVDVAQVNIVFKDLHSNVMVLNVTADGSGSIFEDPDQAVKVTFNHQATNNSVVVIANVSQADRWPVFNNLNVKCDVYLDPSTDVTLQVRSSVGNIAMDADSDVTLEGLRLESATGEIDVRLSEGVVAAGSVSLRTTTGTVQFEMDEADVSGNIPVNLRSNTGAVNVDLAATRILSGNVTVNARTTTGSVNLDMAIDGDIGARIESATDLGGITSDLKRFSGNESPIQSNNYPAGSNFLVDLRTGTGGIGINAVYGSSSVLN